MFTWLFSNVRRVFRSFSGSDRNSSNPAETISDPMVQPVVEPEPAPLPEPEPEVVIVQPVVEPVPIPLPESGDLQAGVGDDAHSAAEAFLAMTDRAVGLDDPSVSVGLAGLADWIPAMQTIDLIKFSRPVLAHESGSWGGYSNDYLSDNGLSLIHI